MSVDRFHHILWTSAILECRIAVTVGTSAAIRIVLPLDIMKSAEVPRGLWCYRISEKHVLLGGALSDGGSMFRWLHESLNLPTDGV